jgi:hypothetical protein
MQDRRRTEAPIDIDLIGRNEPAGYQPRLNIFKEDRRRLQSAPRQCNAAMNEFVPLSSTARRSLPQANLPWRTFWNFLRKHPEAARVRCLIA